MATRDRRRGQETRGRREGNRSFGSCSSGKELDVGDDDIARIEQTVQLDLVVQRAKVAGEGFLLSQGRQRHLKRLNVPFGY